LSRLAINAPADRHRCNRINDTGRKGWKSHFIWKGLMKITVKITCQPDGTYRASCPALPGCRVQGRSYEDAKHKIDSAVRGYLGSLNVAIPKERERNFLKF